MTDPGAWSEADLLRARLAALAALPCRQCFGEGWYVDNGGHAHDVPVRRLCASCDGTGRQLPMLSEP